MSVYYQTSPVITPPRSYYPSSPDRYARQSIYAQPLSPYNTYATTYPLTQPAQYGYYSPTGGYYPNGSPILTVAQQPRYTSPMVYSIPRIHRHRHRSRSHHRNDDCCSSTLCCNSRSTSRNWYGYTVRYGRVNDDCGCCSSPSNNYYDRWYYPRRNNCC